NFTNLQWLRSVGYKVNMEVLIREATLNAEPIRSLRAAIDIAPGVLTIDSFSIDSNVAAFDGSLAIDMRALKPGLAVSVKGKKLDTDFLSDFIPASTEASGKPGGNKFRFPRLDKFKGNITIGLDQLIDDTVPIGNLAANIRIDNGFVILEKIT